MRKYDLAPPGSERSDGEVPSGIDSVQFCRLD